ncbi:MAG: hypothetical protein AAGH76_07640 [Pseudomonadota bacterium]
MTSFGYFMLASVVTGAALLYLRATDSKRARVFGQTVAKPTKTLRHTIGIGVWIPGIVLLGLRQYSAFLSWCGALLVFGWAIAAMAPAGAVETTTLSDADGKEK